MKQINYRRNMIKSNFKNIRNTENLILLQTFIAQLYQYSFSQKKRHTFKKISENFQFIKQNLEKNRDLDNLFNEIIIKKANNNKQPDINIFHNKSQHENQKTIIQQNFRHPYKKLIFSKNIPFRDFISFLCKVYMDLQYAINLKQPSVQFINSKYQYIEQPTSKRKKILLLQLNQTLIYSRQGYFQHFDHQFHIKTLTTNQMISYNIRPYCYQFLSTIQKYYQIYIFTTSCYQYAINIIKQLNITQKYISGVLTRESCMQTKKGYLIKNLKILKNIDLKNVVIIDTNVYSFSLHLDNGIPIFPYDGNEQDQQLNGISGFLTQVSRYQDVRIPISQRFNLKSLAKLHRIDILQSTKQNC